MKETRTINIGGLVFHIDYDAYQSLSSYLQDIELRLPTEERVEVMADIEARISELLQKNLFALNVQVVDITMIQAIQEQMGAPSEFGENKRPKVKHTATHQRSGCGRALAVSGIIVLALCAVPIIIPVIVSIFAVLAAVLGVSIAMPVWLFGGDAVMGALLVGLGLLALLIPIVILIHTIITWMRTRRGPSARFWWIILSIWVLSLIGTGVLMHRCTAEYGGMGALISQVIDEDDDEVDLEEVREVEPFQAIDVCSAITMHIEQGEEYVVTVKSNRGTHVTTEVKDQVLYVYQDDNRYAHTEVDIVVPTLSAIRVAGASEARINEPFQTDSLSVEVIGASKGHFSVIAQQLRLEVAGASGLQVEGNAQQVDAQLYGASKMESEWLNAQSMHINCAGASKAEIYVEKELWAQAVGASKIKYKGSPKVKQKMAVGGSSIRKD